MRKIILGHRNRLSVKHLVKNAIKGSLFPCLYRYYPHGLHVFADLRKNLKNYEVKIVFDVGANVGQSAHSFARMYPHSHILCFEPVNETFGQLCANVGSAKRIDCFPIAFGSKAQTKKLYLEENSETNSLLDSRSRGDMSIDGFQNVDIITIDSFCADRNIGNIDFLKIDTEGYDLEVLKGCSDMLASKKISVIQTEVGMTALNDIHVPLHDVQKYLEGHNYWLFGIYDQVLEWSLKPQLQFNPPLRRCNAVFLSGRYIN